MSFSNSGIKSGILVLEILCSDVNSINSINIEYPIPRRAVTAVQHSTLVVEHNRIAKSRSTSHTAFEIPERSPPVDPIKRECGGIINFLNLNGAFLYNIVTYDKFNCGFSMELTISKNASNIVDDTNIVLYLNNYLIETLLPNRHLGDENIQLSFNSICTSAKLNVFQGLQMVECLPNINYSACTSNVVDLFSYLISQHNEANTFITIKQSRCKLFADIFVTDLSTQDCSKIAKKKYENILPDMYNVIPLHFCINRNKCVFTLSRTFLSMFASNEIATVRELIYSDMVNILSFSKSIDPERYMDTVFDFSDFLSLVERTSTCNKGPLKYVICTALSELCNNYLNAGDEIKLSFIRNDDGYLISLE